MGLQRKKTADDMTAEACLHYMTYSASGLLGPPTCSILGRPTREHSEMRSHTVVEK